MREGWRLGLALALTTLGTGGAAAQGTFDGAYVAVGASAGIAGTRSYSIYDSYPLFTGSGGLVQPRGFSGVAIAGFNIIRRDVLFGLEIDGRFGRESASTSDSVDYTQYVYYGGSGFVSHNYTISNDYSSHISGRIGATFRDTLIFLKAGIGVSQITESAQSDARSAYVCVNVGCPGGRFGNVGAFSVSTWLPSVTAGIGIEQNFGRWFGRLAGEIEAINLGSHSETIRTSRSDSFSVNFGASANSDLFWSSRVTGSIGVRF